MTEKTPIPLSLISLDTSLIVLLYEDGDASVSNDYKRLQWEAHVRSPEDVLSLSPSTDTNDVLKDFRNFYHGTDPRSVVICTPAISSHSNLVAFHALETGYRVFLIVLDLETQVTPEVLRLTNAGVSVLSKASFEAETCFLRTKSTKS